MTTAVTVRDKFLLLEKAVNDQVLEREDVVHTMVLALAARLHHFQGGPPGTAKSMAYHVLRSKIQMVAEEAFEILLTRQTTEDLIFGGRDIPAMKQGRVKLITEGMAPEALLWFLDEIFKCNMSLLNSLLWSLNEGLFRNDGKVESLPLWAMYCASNELPESETELAALYDRIDFRHWVQPLKMPESVVSMFKKHFVATNGPVLDWTDIEQANKEVMAVTIPDGIFDLLAKVRSDLHVENIPTTDRRMVNSLRALQAEAWMNGATEVDIDHLDPLTHMYWDIPDQYATVYKIISRLADPLDKEFGDLLGEIEELESRLSKLDADPDMDSEQRQSLVVEIWRAGKSAKGDFLKLRESAKDNTRKPKKQKDCKAHLQSLTGRLIEKLDLDVVPDSDLDGDD